MAALLLLVNKRKLPDGRVVSTGHQHGGLEADVGLAAVDTVHLSLFMLGGDLRDDAG